MTCAVLFAGQGGEEPRMGLDLCAHEPRANELLARASTRTGVDLRRAIARNDPILTRPAVLQPALVAVELGAWEALVRSGVEVEYTAGHSLGEIAAWAATGAIAAEDAIDLAAERGAAMTDAAANCPGGMVALLGADESAVERALERGGLTLAGRNAPDEWVLSGDEQAIRTVVGRFPSRRLRVAGPWHSPAMANAQPRFRTALASIGATHAAKRTFVSGVTGEVATDPAAIPSSLVDAMVMPVRWCEVMKTLRARGVTRFIVAGPGKTLRALVRKNLGASVTVEIAGDAASVRAIETMRSNAPR